MTLEEIKKSDKVFLNVLDVVPILHFDPQDFRLQVRNNPKVIGFPVSVINHRIRIPRKPFIAFIEGEER